MAFGDRRTPLNRKTELKRGEGPKSDPDKQRAWGRRSRRPLPAKSQQRQDDTPARQELVAEMLAHQRQCAAMIPGLCTGRSTDVNEIIRRSQWAKGYLVRSNCEALCRACHDWITNHPGDDGWAARHGHQLPGWIRDQSQTAYTKAVAMARAIRNKSRGKCGRDCTIDHRLEEEQRREYF